MEELAVTLPAMWADHHVLAVRAVLAETPGVGGVEASARDFALRVRFEPAAASADEILARLAAAGYVPGEAPAAGAGERSKPEWATSGSRATTTNPVDVAMSGDYRKY
jgi:hypothetical protein